MCVEKYGILPCANAKIGSILESVQLMLVQSHQNTSFGQILPTPTTLSSPVFDPGEKTVSRTATVNAQVLQQVLRKLETAFVDMKRKGMGFPRFKNRYRCGRLFILNWEKVNY